MVIHQASHAVLGVLILSVSGCVAVSRTDGARLVGREVAAASRDAPPFNDSGDSGASTARVTELLAAPLTATGAVEVAFLRSPQVLDASARLGLSQADVVAASRISNLGFSGSLITGGGERQVIAGISQPITDLLLLSARKRLASGEYERIQHLVAASLLDLIRDTEVAWYRYVSAEQVKALRAAVARSAEAAEALAQRFFKAGNVSELDLTLLQADSSRARLASLRAEADARRAKYDLQQRMGLAGEPVWRALEVLPAPEIVAEPVEALVARARAHRADLVAARQEVELLGEAVSIAKRWRWLGTAEVGIERERETDRRKLTGPTLSLALPIFNQGQAGIARAKATLEQNRSRVLALEATVENDVRFGVERVTVTLHIVEEYRQSLVRQHEVIVKRQQERQNFMFIGQFELLLSKQQQYDAYQGYLEAIRDYWLARVDLARAVGSDLLSGEAAPGPAVGVDAILQAPTESTEHGEHHHHGGDTLPPSTKPDNASEPDMHDMPGMSGMRGMQAEPPAAPTPTEGAIVPQGDRP